MESDDFDKELLAPPETLKELFKNYKRKKWNFNKQDKRLNSIQNPKEETSIFDHLASNIFIFVIAIVLLMVTVIVIMILCKGAKMWALIAGLVMKKSVKALIEGKDSCSRYEYLVIIALLTLILLGIIFFDYWKSI